MMLSRPHYTPLGIDFGHGRVKVVQLRRERREHRVSGAAVLPRAKPGAAVDAGEADRVMDALWRQGLRGSRVVLGVPAGELLSAVMELPPRASGAPMGLIARQELARASKANPNEIEMDWWELPGGARANEGTHVMAVGCRHSTASAVLKAFESAGAEVVALDAPGLALVRACRPALAGPGELTAVIDLGWTSSEILIVREGLVVYERCMNELGLGELRKALATSAGVDTDTAQFALDRIGCAEPLPGQEDWQSGPETRRRVAAHADTIAGEIRMSLAYAARRFGSSPSRVLITGLGLSIPGVIDRIKGAEPLATPLSLADVVPTDPESGVGVDHASLLRALGLALHGTPAMEAAA